MADLVVVPADALAINKRSIKRIAGETMTAAQLVRIDVTDENKAKLAKGDDVGTATLAGVTLNGASDGQPIEIQYEGDFVPGVDLVPATVYMLSAATAGGIAPVADLLSTNIASILGVAINTTTIRLGILNSGAALP